MGNFSVLVVEDDDTIRKLLVEYLGLTHLSVDSARDGVEALHHVALNRYRVIVLDVMMPKMSGVDFLNSLEAMLDDASIRSCSSSPRRRRAICRGARCSSGIRNSCGASSGSHSICPSWGKQ
jgi:CheY-like chemotaxis protein